MNNHRIIAGGGLLLALIAVTLWAAVVQGQSSNNQPYQGGLQNGRFMLYQGSFEIRDENSRPSTGLFKIDSANGRVWRYEQEPAKPNHSTKPNKPAKAKWVEVDQF